MSKKTLYLLGIALTIIFGTILYQIFCCNCCMKIPDAETNKVKVSDIGMTNFSPFNLKGSGIDYHCNDNLKFMKNGFKTILPISDSVNLGINNLKLFLEKNPTQKLLITGYATSDEKNTSAYPNLGEARANDIKNYFVTKGIEASRFDTKGEIRDTWKMSADTLLGPADYSIISSSVSTSESTDWNALKEKINANPLILYFNTGQSDIKLTAEERQKVADLVHYLDNVKDSKLSAVGHTDNVGNSDLNTKLGLNRANFAKEYLAKNGVSNVKIETSSKGPNEPIADNNSIAGKAKNRRTVVTIK